MISLSAWKYKIFTIFVGWFYCWRFSVSPEPGGLSFGFFFCRGLLILILSWRWCFTLMFICFRFYCVTDTGFQVFPIRDRLSLVLGVIRNWIRHGSNNAIRCQFRLITVNSTFLLRGRILSARTKCLWERNACSKGPCWFISAVAGGRKIGLWSIAKTTKMARALADLNVVARSEFKLKPEQEVAVKSLLDGKDVLAVLPTGYGKSLIIKCLFAQRILKWMVKQRFWWFLRWLASQKIRYWTWNQ